MTVGGWTRVGPGLDLGWTIKSRKLLNNKTISSFGLDYEKKRQKKCVFCKNRTVNRRFRTDNRRFRVANQRFRVVNVSFRTVNVSFRTVNVSFSTANVSFRIANTERMKMFLKVKIRKKWGKVV